jgi:predicted phage terminase large subunit-like protein
MRINSPTRSTGRRPTISGVHSLCQDGIAGTLTSVIGRQRVVRRIGDLLHPARESRETLQLLQAGLGEYNFAGQYQQSPVPLGGGLVKLEWIRYYEPHDIPEKFDQILQSWDTANKETELANFSVCTTWGIKGDVRYLLNVMRRRMNFPDLKRAVMELIREYRPDIVLIEDKASGTQLIQELRHGGISSIKEVKPESNKIMRMNAQTGAFEGGFVRLPRQAPWLDAFRSELTTFPKGRYNDQVDSTAQALAWITMNGVEPAMITYYRRLAEQA